MRSKLKIIIPIIIAVIAVIIAAVCIRFTPSETTDISSLVSTAQKYLIEQNYEQAIAEFEKVIELDPMNVDAYISIAEAYEGMGDTDKAIEWLEKGYDITGDERILEMLERLRQTEEAEAVTESTASETVTATETTTVSETTAAPIEYTSEELEEVLLTLIENPDADIPQSMLDAIYTIEIYGDNYYLVNRSIFEKYDNIRQINMGGEYSVEFKDGSKSELSRGSIASLDFIRNMNNVRSLTLDYNNIADIDALKGLTQLYSLNMFSNQISDISAVSGLTQLYSLNMQRNQISDISALSELTNLNYLGLYENNISDISAVSGLTNLINLDISNNNISDISAVSGLTNLTNLDIGGNQISDISALKELTNLTELLLGYNNISDSDIEALKQALPNCEIFS